jgi:DNA-3-methyladenine glycosylase
MQNKMLSESFYQQPTLSLAQALLGMHLVRRCRGETLRGRIVEVEAYHQDNDPAAHSFRGKTERNAVMFGPPGHLYVYFIYGVHYCMNVVTEAEGVGAAVLIRGIEPLAGHDFMQRQRGEKIKGRQLTNGPGKCCQAFDIGPKQNGINLVSDELFLENPEDGNLLSDSESLATSPRIGISKAIELLWRFYLEGNPYVSKPPRAFPKNQ